jgi:hypothetical protein
VKTLKRITVCSYFRVHNSMSGLVDGNLWLITGQAPWCVLFCPLCIPAVLLFSSSAQQHPTYDWVALLQCFQCMFAGFAICNARQFIINNQCIGTIIGAIHQGKKVVPKGVEYLQRKWMMCIMNMLIM